MAERKKIARPSADVLETLRKTMSEAEEAGLSLAASRSRFATRRREVSSEGDLAHPSTEYRTAFQRDRDRIVHSRAFRRLKHKTQVFIPFEGDHFRTRLTHTLEVSQIARTIARALRLSEDLAEACALGHDLGHTPFGHSGEKVLNWILTGTDEQVILPREVAAKAGSFKHNYQSVRIVDLLERRYEMPGINLTDESREGILKHTTWKKDFPFPLPEREGLRLDRACHLEGQIVSWADEIAQQAHDLEDGLAGLAPSRLREVEIAGVTGALEGESGDSISLIGRARLIRGIIAILVTDLIVASAARIEKWLTDQKVSSPEDFQRKKDKLPGSLVSFSKDGERMYHDLKEFVYRYVIQMFPIARNDGRARIVVRGLFSAYHENPRLIADYVLKRYSEEGGVPYLREVPLANAEVEVKRNYRNRPMFLRLIADHLAGMTDTYALSEYGALTGAYPSGAEWRNV